MTNTSICAQTVESLAQCKGNATIAVCLPAHNEAATVGTIIDTIRAELVVAVPLIDEIIVIDDASTDATATVAAAAGARVVACSALLPGLGSRRGKGEAMWKSLAATTCDIVVWIDADIVAFDAHFVSRLVAPLINDSNCVFVKGHYQRPIASTGLTGGRVTELVARPALSLYFPGLAEFPQPLSGEIAARRDALITLPFAAGYGVDIGLLIDVCSRYGIDRVRQADLGVRVHRNRPLDELAPQAFEVLHTVLRRAGHHPEKSALLSNAQGDPVAVQVDDRPPMCRVLAT